MEGAGVVRVELQGGIKIPERALVLAEIELRDCPRAAREVAERSSSVALSKSLIACSKSPRSR